MKALGVASFVVLALTAGFAGSPRVARADGPGVDVDYYNGWMKVTLEGSYAGAYYQVWRSGEPAGVFQPLMAEYALCTGDCTVLVQDALAGRTYAYRFDVLVGQTFTSYGPFLVTVPDTPFGVRLFPNPARGAAQVELSLPGDRRTDAPLSATVELFDARGRLVRTLLDGSAERGVTSLAWDGRGEGGRALGSGIYFLRVVSPLGTRVERAVLVGR
jgi:hypothetical protein